MIKVVASMHAIKFKERERDLSLGAAYIVYEMKCTGLGRWFRTTSTRSLVSTGRSVPCALCRIRCCLLLSIGNGACQNSSIRL